MLWAGERVTAMGSLVEAVIKKKLVRFQNMIINQVYPILAKYTGSILQATLSTEVPYSISIVVVATFCIWCKCVTIYLGGCVWL